MTNEIARILPCGCWIVYLAQGKAILPCVRHEPQLLGYMESVSGQA